MTLESNNKTALIVDDDPIVAAMAESYLVQKGFVKISCASDGVEALMILDNTAKDPDLILCDLNMPNMDGVEFIRHLEHRQFNGGIAIISGEDASVISLVESLAKSHKLCLLGKIIKPFKAQEMDEILARMESECRPDDTRSFFEVDAAKLRHAISSGEILAFHQPKVDAQTGAIVGTEVLARWKHPKWGFLSPLHFIPIAEQSGLIGRLTEIIFRQTITDVLRWSRNGFAAKCSVNLSPKMLIDVELPDMLSGLVNDAGLHPSQFVLEITESSIVERTSVPMEILARLRIKQFELSIDDFGTGHSNIDTLRQFPFNELKIDRSFISGMVRDNFCLETVRSSVEFARNLGLRTVGEGVENEEEQKIARSLGIDQLQGYLFGKPMPASDIRIQPSFKAAI